MILPQSHTLTTRHLNRVFDNTVATYKYYWFLGILDLCVKQGKSRINVWDIMISMVANAWYPVNYFRLSFGKSESLYDAILTLQREYNIPINIGINELTELLQALIQRREVRRLLNFLQQNVPFRFLRPWIDTSDDRQTVLRSQTFENGCLYKLERIDHIWWIELNPAWLPYLRENYDILTSFAYWGLTNFLQVRNPNVPNIPNKLIKKEERSSLLEQRKFWNTAISNGLEVRCLYTDKLLVVREYELDHFIPWSFVSHDLLWNLMPADASINSSKSNKLPDLNLYLPKLAEAHQAALRINLEIGRQNKLMEDYLSLGHTPQDIALMDREHLLNCFFQTFTPMTQIAHNMGFESWRYYPMDKVNCPYLTAIKRTAMSAPTRYLLQHGLLKGRILDFGCGHGFDADELKRLGYNIVGYDSCYRPDYPEGKFDTIICVYVLNVLEPYAQAEVIWEISNLLAPGGTVYYAVRRDLKEEGFRWHAIHKQYTYQCNVVLPYKSLVKNKGFEIYYKQSI